MPFATGRSRTLPFHVEPVNGEALDSWLEAIALRHDAPFGAVLRRCRIHALTLRDGWMIRPQRADIARLADVTGVEPSVLGDMTLARYIGAVNLGRGGGRPRPSAWGWRATSRLCPECLADTDGRWQIAWRLNWTFACVKHRRLLADVCPQCRGLQRHRTHSTLRIPAPKRCARTHRQPHSGKAAPCLADLTAATAPVLVDAPAVLQAQRRIDRLLNCEPIDLSLYGTHPPPLRDLLNDVKIIARWAMSTVGHDQIAQHIPADVLDCLTPQGTRYMAQNHRTNPTAAQAAAGITMALTVLTAPDARASARILHELMAVTDRRMGNSGNVAGREALSPAVKLALDYAANDVAGAIAARRTSKPLERRAPRATRSSGEHLHASGR